MDLTILSHVIHHNYRKREQIYEAYTKNYGRCYSTFPTTCKRYALYAQEQLMEQMLRP